MKDRGAIEASPTKRELAPYVGRWVAIVRGQIVAVGESEIQARRASKHQRSKEEPRVLFVSEETMRKK